MLEITITPTDEIHCLDGVEVRLWKGTAPDGTPLAVWVHRVGCPPDTQIATELEQHTDERPSPDQLIVTHYAGITIGLIASLLIAADDVALKTGSKHGLCDAINNDGQPYRSALLDSVLHICRTQYTTTEAADRPESNEGGPDDAA